MVISTKVPAQHWYRELKANVEPSLCGIAFSKAARSNTRAEYVQVELKRTHNEKHNKALMLCELKGDVAKQKILDRLRLHIEDKFGYIMRGFDVDSDM